MNFTCTRCNEPFPEKGLHLVVHDVDVCRLCPACLSGAGEVRLLIRSESAGKPFSPALIEITPREEARA